MILNKIEENIKYKFNNILLLKTALTHTSYANENKLESNEKLEFLGDAILEFVVSEYLFKNYKNLKEGQMTKVRATVVCENSLHKIALKHHFNEFLFLGKSEQVTGGRSKVAILADSVEAVIAAIYCDSGIESVKKFIIDNLSEEIEIATKTVGMKDYKTVLQEKLQEHGSVKIKYIILQEKGPDHNKSFLAEVRCEGKPLATGKGTTKKNAEMEAAKNALENINKK